MGYKMEQIFQFARQMHDKKIKKPDNQSIIRL